MRRRLLLPASAVAGVALGALLACASPDEISTAVFGGRTNYPSETSQWDSQNYGAEVRVSYDVGQRARAHDAEIKLLDEMIAARRRAGPEQTPPGADKPATESAQLIVILIALATAATGYFQRANITKGVKCLHEKVTRKKTHETQPVQRP